MAESAKGALFKNDKKVPESKQPDWTGNVELTVELLQTLLREAQVSGAYKARLAAWVRSGTHGTFLSIALEPPFVKGAQQRPTTAPPRKPDPFGEPPF